MGRAWCDGVVAKVLALHASVLIPAAPLPIQLPACGMGKQSRMAQSFGTLHPHGRPRKKLLAPGFGLAQSRCCGHLGSKPLDIRSSSLSLLLSVYLPFQ